MIITLKGADFSANKIGTLTTWSVFTTLGGGASYSGASLVNRGAAFSGTVTIAEGYELGSAGVTVMMGGEDVTSTAAAINGSTITISIAAVTGTVYISVPTVNTATGEEDDGGVRPVLIDEYTGKTLTGGTYGAGGALYVMPTNIAAGTYISHIDFPACSGNKYSNPAEPITLDSLIIYRVDTNGYIAEELANVEDITSFESDRDETAGLQIYRVNINKKLANTSHIGIRVTPANTTTAPTIPYVSGVSSLGNCYFGGVKGIGDTVTLNTTSFHAAYVIYK